MAWKLTVIASMLPMIFAVGDAGGASPLVDGHNHDAISASGGAIDVSGLENLRSCGLDAVVVPLPLDRSDTSDLAARIDDELRLLNRMAADHPGFAITDRPGAVTERAVEKGIQLLFSIEWFGVIFGDDPGVVERYRDLGVRMIGLTADDPEGLFGEGKASATLTPFGTRVLDAMNRAGILIDITHLNHQQKLEIINRSSAPVVATHALAAEVRPTSFNIPPDVLKALAERGGSVWVSFNSSDLLGGRPEGDAFDLLADHIELLIDRLGAEHVGIGSDLQAGGRYVPEPLNRAEAFAEIGRKLLERGYSQKTVNGVLGVNVLRTLAGDFGGKADESAGSEIEWVTVTASAFTMGSDEGDKADQSPAHEVYLDEFEISRHEITVGQYARFVDATGYVTEVERNGTGHGYDGTTWVGDPGLSWLNPGIAQANDHPVVQVTKNDALEYCRWLSELTGDAIDLPTEAQWEKAARGEDLRPYPWGDDPVDGTRCNLADKQLGHAEFSSLDLDDGFKFTSPVGSFPDGRSPFGVDDLCGNVWEWIRDLYSENYYSQSPRRNPDGPEDGPYDMTRGGAWGIGGQFENRLKSTWRNINTPGRGFDVVGFRIVREARNPRD